MSKKTKPRAKPPSIRKHLEKRLSGIIKAVEEQQHPPGSPQEITIGYLGKFTFTKMGTWEHPIPKTYTWEEYLPKVGNVGDPFFGRESAVGFYNSLATRANVEMPQRTMPIQDAIGLIREESESLFADTEKQIIANIEQFLPPEKQEAAKTFPAIAMRWPWPAENRAGALLHSLCVGKRQLKLPMHEIFPHALPPELSAIELSQWLEPKLLELEGSPKQVKEVLEPLHVGVPIVIAWNMDGKASTAPIAGLALLYLSLENDRFGRGEQPDMFLISVGKPMAKTVTGLVGSKYKAEEEEVWQNKNRRRRSEADPPLELQFTWDTGGQITFPFYEGGGPFLAISQQYGPAYVRDLFALFFFTWAQKKKAGENIWWWPHEHVERCNLRDKHAKRDATARLEKLSRVHLKALYKTGSPLEGPLVTMGMRRDKARSLHLHSALYRGVTNIDGSLGSYFWALPIKLLQLPANEKSTHVHVLSFAAAELWRARGLPQDGEPSTARIKVDKLAKKIGINKRGDRRVDNQQANVLKAALEQGKALGVWNWSHKGGKFEAFEGTIELTAGKETSELVKSRFIQRPPLIPTTGDDLALWIQGTGETLASLAEKLRIAESTLRRVRKFGVRPLPEKTRDALRAFLWQ